MVFITPIHLGFVTTIENDANKPLIIHFGNDSPVRQAVAVLQQNLDSFRIIHVNSIKDLFLPIGSYKATFFVGHGSSEGIGTSSSIKLSWDDIERYCSKYSATKFYFIACNAQQILINRGLPMFGTPGVIDAEIGAYMALTKFAIDFALHTLVLDVFFPLLNLITTKPVTQYQTLDFWLIDQGNIHLSWNEAIYWGVEGLTVLMLGITGLSLIPTAGVKTAVRVTLLLYTTADLLFFFYNLGLFLDGQMTAEFFFGTILSFIAPFFLLVAGNLPYYLTPWDMLIFGTALIATLIAWTGSSGAAMLISLLATAAVFIISLCGFLNDYHDDDMMIG